MEQGVNGARFKDKAWVLTIAVVTLLAFVLRWYYVATAQVMNPVRGDAVQYFSYAWNLVQHSVFSQARPGSVSVLPDSYRDPGYPMFLAMWMKALGAGSKWYATVMLAQALLGALTVLWAMLLGRYWLPIGAVLFGGVVMALWPHSVVIDSFLLSETLLGFLCTLALLMCARAIRARSMWWALAAGLMFSAAGLTNAVLLPFGLLLAFYMAWKHWLPRSVLVAFTLSTIILPGLWMLRNSELPQQTGSVTSSDRALQNLVQGSWPDYQAAYILATIYRDPHAQEVLSSIDQEYQLLRTAPGKGAKLILHRLSMHPWHYLAWYVVDKPRLFWGWNIRMGQGDIYVYQTRHSPFSTKIVLGAWEWLCHAVNGVLGALAFLGVILSLLRLRRGKSQALMAMEMTQGMVGMLLVFLTVVYSVFQSDPRYAIPFRALEILMAVSAGVTIGRWIRGAINKGKATTAPGSLTSV